MALRGRSVGLGLAVVSAATFGTSGSFADSLMASGWTPGGAVTVRIGLAALALTVPALFVLRGRWRSLRTGAADVAAYGLVALAGCQLFFFNAVEHLSVGVALLLEYSGTLFVVLWLWLRHGQRPSRLTVAGGLIAIVGLVLVLDLTGPQRVDLVGVLWGLGAAAGLATYFVVSSHSDAQLHPVAMAWAGCVLGFTALAVFALVGLIPFETRAADVDLGGARLSWLVPALGVALVATVAAYTTGIAAARRLGAKVASFVGLAEVLFAILFAWLLLDQQPSVLQLIGGLVVLAGIALVRVDERDGATGDDAALEIPLAGASSSG
ncbi:Threonine/homoserine efflux transporter RhtA [Jatrophihabitans endophyticus]|uniref:Threonine/homoserine efflux transporter RhtA n=1 Tax=Jatrophihabitans endophyticus TaxID=1206085 RepID=A0A1M5TTV1_9ACTN|nr:Threonine/homoserine efflux transporter RhtA [Jatrophihabitans endophyticus]